MTGTNLADVKKKLPQWSMLPAEVEVTHFYGISEFGIPKVSMKLTDFPFKFWILYFSYKAAIILGMVQIRNTVARNNFFFLNIFWGIFFFLFEQYSALLHLPPLRFHCADGCWDRTQDCCNWCIGSQTL